LRERKVSEYNLPLRGSAAAVPATVVTTQHADPIHTRREVYTQRPQPCEKLAVGGTPRFGALHSRLAQVGIYASGNAGHGVTTAPAFLLPAWPLGVGARNMAWRLPLEHDEAARC